MNALGWRLLILYLLYQAREVRPFFRICYSKQAGQLSPSKVSLLMNFNVKSFYRTNLDQGKDKCAVFQHFTTNTVFVPTDTMIKYDPLFSEMRRTVTAPSSPPLIQDKKSQIVCGFLQTKLVARHFVNDVVQSQNNLFRPKVISTEDCKIYTE